MANGRRFRVLNISGDSTHEFLGAIPDTSFSDYRLARELTAIIERSGKPGMAVRDNGTELTSHAIHGCVLTFDFSAHATATHSLDRYPHRAISMI